MRGETPLPLLLPWWAGAGLMAVGVALIYLGHRQRKAEFDITRIPLTSAPFKMFVGIALLLFGLLQALGPLLG